MESLAWQSTWFRYGRRKKVRYSLLARFLPTDWSVTLIIGSKTKNEKEAFEFVEFNVGGVERKTSDRVHRSLSGLRAWIRFYRHDINSHWKQSTRRRRPYRPTRRRVDQRVQQLSLYMLVRTTRENAATMSGCELPHYTESPCLRLVLNKMSDLLFQGYERYYYWCTLWFTYVSAKAYSKFLISIIDTLNDVIFFLS